MGIGGRGVGAALLVVATLAAGCASPPVRVHRANPEQVQRELTANVLSTGRPSPRSIQFLERFALRKRFREDPAGVLALLHKDLAPQGDQRRLSALGELSFYHALRTGDRRYYFMAAAYSYALLFPGTGEETLDESDPRVRLAYDLYNRGLTEAMATDRDGQVDLHSATHELPFGSVEVEVPDDELFWAGHRLGGLVSSADYEVEGLRNRYRRPGIGAPLSATIGTEQRDGAVPAERFLPGMRVPATVFAAHRGAAARAQGGEAQGPRRGLHAGRGAERGHRRTRGAGGVRGELLAGVLPRRLAALGLRAARLLLGDLPPAEARRGDGRRTR